MGAAELGARLREVRELRGQSLSEVATKAEISPAYLQKLEKGAVQAPSPHVLQRLAVALKVEYRTLMELAGYVVPGGKRPRSASLLAHALSSENLSEDEAHELARYLAWYRHQKRRAAG